MTRAPKTPVELDELVDLPEDEAEELARALLAAWAPTELDAAVNEALIAAAIEDPLAPPTDEEVAESERLRLALDGHGEHPDAVLAHALRLAVTPSELETDASERLAEAVASPHASPKRRSNVLYVTFGAVGTAIAALAASWLLLLRPALDSGGGRDLARQAQDLAVSRSTAALFSEKFETSATTHRVDRIASARSRELRSNRYALWGVR